MMMPMNLYKELKSLSLNGKHGGRYQVLIKEILSEYTEKHSKSKKMRSA